MYDRIYVFSKHTSLNEGGYVPNPMLGNTISVEHYDEQRDIQLILRVKFDHGHRYCNIKCPINPLPVKGEFEVPSANAVIRFIESNGWKLLYTETLHVFK